MTKTRTCLLITAIIALLGILPLTAAANGLVGQCVDCHTMHNSEQGQAVAKIGTDGTISSSPIPNLLRMDCVACHAQGTGERVVTMTGGSKVPQVYHNDPIADLAAGNYAYISGTKQGHGGTSGNRKGHNVVDLVNAETELSYPPGFRHAGTDVMGAFDVGSFTCAGSMGCHGYRGQVLGTVSSDPDCNPEFEQCQEEETVFRTGLTALSGYDGIGTNVELKRGAHHYNYDGLKLDGNNANFFDNPLAHSYRFIRSLIGYGNEAERWHNLNAASHNEYFGGYEGALGETVKETDYGTTTTCSRCHVGGSINDTSSRLTTPGQTMTGFCITCHGSFHSSGVTNGASGAFLRHPSDYVIPNQGEYAAYTLYNTTAPVGRPAAFFADGMTASPTVNPGQDMVICLSCHMAHASPYDGMLRFDYGAMVAGGNTEQVGCLACHTTKGVPVADRL